MSVAISTAFDLTFPSWPPPERPLRRGQSAPLGAIRRARKGRSVRREIKVSMDARPGRRWIGLARYWWLRNVGPIPEDMRVCHADGDTLNDDPHNYELMTAADVICLHHLNNPRWSEQQHRRCGRATARHNRQRAQVERARRWLPCRWYAVDPILRVIHNVPKRKRWQVYAAHGVPLKPSPNGHAYIGAVLGWPSLGAIEAAALATLLTDPLATSHCWRALQRVYVTGRWIPPRRRTSLYSALSRLRKADLITTARGEDSLADVSVHQATATAVGQRERVCPVVAVRGSDLGVAEFQDFTKV